MEAIQLKLLYEEKEFLKEISAKNGMNMSQYIENLLNDEVHRLMSESKDYKVDRYKYIVPVKLDSKTFQYTDLHKKMYREKEFESFSDYVRTLIKEDIQKRAKKK
mgnify:CR=1 FL=1